MTGLRCVRCREPLGSAPVTRTRYQDLVLTCQCGIKYTIEVSQTDPDETTTLFEDDDGSEATR